MQRFSKLWLGFALVVLVLVPASSFADSIPLSEVDVLTLEAPDREALFVRDAEEAGPGVAPRYAEPLDVAVTPKDRGSWDFTEDG
ncbi:MAG: hypothetical protein AAFY88_14705, partial [Acidobacteriota bacterium]